VLAARIDFVGGEGLLEVFLLILVSSTPQSIETHGQKLERIALSTLKADDESDGAKNGRMTRTASYQRIRLGGESG
jgi:hypothetical protein